MDECWEQDRSHLTARDTESQRESESQGESERQRDRETERQRVRETGRQREDRSHLFCHSELCVHQNHLRHVDVSVYYEGMAGRGESATHRHRQHHRNQRADVWNEIECKGEQPPDEPKLDREATEDEHDHASSESGELRLEQHLLQERVTDRSAVRNSRGSKYKTVH